MLNRVPIMHHRCKLPFITVFATGVMSLLAMLNAATLDQLEKQGIQAMRDRLPEVAAARFNEALQQPGIDPSVNHRITLLLAEAYVRSGQYEHTLVLLPDDVVKKIPDAAYWKSIAYTADGQLGKAEETLQPYISLTKSRYLVEALLTLSRVQANRGDIRSAIATLNRLTTDKSPAATRAKLDQGSLLLLLGQHTEARKALPAKGSLTKANAFEARLLEARILLAENQADEALKSYTSLRSEFLKSNQPATDAANTLPPSFHQVAIGEARAKFALGQDADATDVLLAFIQNHPESAMISEAFELLESRISAPSPEANDPIRARIIERINEWSPIFTPPSSSLIALDDSSVSSTNQTGIDSVPTHLQLHALHARIVAADVFSNEKMVAEMRSLMFAMDTSYPGHVLTADAWLRWARNLIERKNIEESARVLNFLLENSSGSTRSNATIVLAKQAFDSKDFTTATQLFQQASEVLRSTPRNAAWFNAAITALEGDSTPSFQNILKDVRPKLRVNILLEQALYTAKENPNQALPLLDSFLLEHETHSRASEARIAAALCALRIAPADLSLAKSQIDSIDPTSAQPQDFLSVRIALANAEKKYAIVATLCREFLENFPQSLQAPQTKLTLGASLYHNGDHADARLVLQELAEAHPTYAAPAMMIAARAAARTGTPQSIAESAALYDKIAALQSSLSDAAILEKSRVLIDAKSAQHLDAARVALEEYNKKISPSSTSYIPTSMLLIECYYALGATSADYYSQGLSLQRKLLDSPNLDLSNRHRVCYFRGLTLEQLNKPNEAIDLYYQVIDSARETPPVAWDYFERCAFNAISLLEKNKRWESAVILAKKIAALNGPRASEAALRARRLGLEHFIWEE